VVNLSGWHSILALESLVSNGWKVHVGSFLSDLNSLELSIMEIISIVDVLDLCWVDFLFQSSEVIFTKFSGVLCLESVLYRVTKTYIVFSIDRFASSFSKTLSIEILTRYLRYVTSISRDVLCFNIRVWSSNPIFSFH
jgi:hypothetical protein